MIDFHYFFGSTPESLKLVKLIFQKKWQNSKNNLSYNIWLLSDNDEVRESPEPISAVNSSLVADIDGKRHRQNIRFGFSKEKK